MGRCHVGDKGNVMRGHGVRRVGLCSSDRNAYASSVHLRVRNQTIHGLGQPREIFRLSPAAGYRLRWQVVHDSAGAVRIDQVGQRLGPVVNPSIDVRV